jgi:aldose sugar dehydrogenase
MGRNLKLIIGILLVLIVIFLALVLFLPNPVKELGNVTEQGNGTEILAENLNIPWALAFLPDDRLIFTERGGKVSVLDGKNISLVGNINVTQISESGLLGIAVDPHFNQNHYVYLYYTRGKYNRISRFLLRDKLSGEKVLLDKIPAASRHNGGRLKFGPDGKIYATTGESHIANLAQDLNSLGGKILRINPDGSIPADNPFGNYVYAYGNRDPQGIAWSPEGIMYESEHGAARNDEINIIQKGGNYGWPIYQGNKSAPGYVKPLRVYTEFTLAPSGITFYQNNLYVAGLRGSQLRKITLSADGKSVIAEKALYTDLGRIRDAVEYKGYIYICTSNREAKGVPRIGDDKIIRIKIS